MIDLGPAILILTAWIIAAFAAGPTVGRYLADLDGQDRCGIPDCGHTRRHHTHHHAATYCSATDCGCTRFHQGARR